MPEVPELIDSLLQSLREQLGSAGASIGAIEELLAERPLHDQAAEILGRSKGKGQPRDVDEGALWETFSQALATVLESGEPAGASAVEEAIARRLKELAADRQREWLVLIPTDAAPRGAGAVFDGLSTADVPRVLTGPATGAQASHLLTNAGSLVGCTLPASFSPPSLPSASLFVVAARGPADTALRSALREIRLVRDSLQYAYHVLTGDRALRSPVLPASPPNATDAWLIDSGTGLSVTQLVRDPDFSLRHILEVLHTPRGMELYDQAARLLEKYREGGQEGKEIGLPLARSVRIFSRAVRVGNVDLRFLLLLVALETVLSRQEGISEELAQMSALLTKEAVSERATVHGEIKQAYNTRSKFVHEGRLPAEFAGEKLSAQESAVFAAWVGVMRRLLPLAEEGSATDWVFERFKWLKLGAPWEDAFPSAP